jgi:hypothetical protein
MTCGRRSTSNPLEALSQRYQRVSGQAKTKPLATLSQWPAAIASTRCGCLPHWVGRARKTPSAVTQESNGR